MGKSNDQWIMIVICMMLFTMPLVSAVSNETGEFKMPGFSESWKSVDDYIKEKIYWLIGIALVALVIAAILCGGLSGIKAMIATLRGDSTGRSHGITDLFIIVAVVFFAFLIFALILVIAG